METGTFALGAYGEMNNELFRELQGIAEITEIPVYEIMVSNFIYELFAHCTSIISIDHNGEIIHGRNLDYPIFDSMRDDTYDAHFMKNGELEFYATLSGGSPSPYTLMKPGKFAISINARYHNTLPGLANSLTRYFLNSQNPGSMIKYVGEHANSFKEAKEMLMTLPLTSPCYFTISGTEPHEGAIITRSRSGVDDLWNINPDSKIDWAIYQTNYDHWISQAPDRDHKRAASAKQSLKDLGVKNMNIKKIIKKVLQVPPVMQKETIFAVAMSAKRGIYKTYRYI